MIENAIASLGVYLIPFILIIVEIIIGLFLVGRRALLSYDIKGQKGHERGEKIYLNLVGSSLKQAHVLVGHEKRKVLFLTDQTTEVTGVSKERLYSSIDELTARMDKEESRNFWHAYNTWNQKDHLVTDYYDHVLEKWMCLSVSASEDHQYDIFVFEDISALKKQEDSINEKLVQAESISQSKTTFLFRMSHEIRTPMNGIIGLLTLIENEPHNEMIETYLKKARESSNYLLRLINDILDISRIENDRLELEEKPFDIYDVAGEMQNMFQRTVESKGVAFVMETEELKNHYVIGDRLRFTQVIMNFVSNAVKFTSEGEIRITFKEMMAQDNHVNFMIRVHDTGKGMDPAFVEKIFRPFEQENSSIHTKYGGTGLGMAITENIVHLMGGEIIVDTYPNKGSDFTVYLTMKQATKEQVANEVKEEVVSEPFEYSFAGKHILMAEDNEINVEVAEAILTQMGAHVEIAGNGREVIEMFASHPAGTYDFILMDIQMPILDGRSAAMKIRSLDREDAEEIPIFALSADAFVEDQRLSAANKMNGHFAKPIDFKALEAGVGRYMCQKRGMKK